MRTVRQSLCILTATALFACAGEETPVADSTGALDVYEFIVDAALFSSWGRDTVRLAPRRPVRIQLLSESIERAPSADAAARSRQWLREEMPELPDALVEIYVSNTFQPTAISTDLKTQVLLTLRSPDEFPALIRRPYSRWRDLASFLRPTAYVALGPVMFVPDSTEALVEVSTFRGPMDASAILVWLRQSDDGWSIAGYTIAWIS